MCPTSERNRSQQNTKTERNKKMEILTIVLIPIILILGFCTLFMPYFVYCIHKNAKDQLTLLRANLEAQNHIIKILWETQQQVK